MKSVRTTCHPRSDLVAGTFNPEVFTASLSQVIAHYRGKRSQLASVYTDPKQFFGEATFPTDGMRQLLHEVFARLNGDGAVPAIHRLETAFGGGKTHSLIAATHIAHHGTAIADIVTPLVKAAVLPKPGEVAIIGIAGDEIPVVKPQGTDLTPYTLWGEIAFQIGGAALYESVATEASSHAAPSRNFLEKILGGRKAIIMLDELAQYTTRLEAARPDGAAQLAAFLMSLHGYARTNPGVSILFTLASSDDAFSKQTKHLAKLIGAVKGEAVSEDSALHLAIRADRDVRSVVSRDSVTVVPVQASEVSRVLAKRLFSSIDAQAAAEAQREYTALYAKHSASLPPEAQRADYLDRIQAHYPFHPTLVDFLTKKLSTVETFQGTRGVLRVLAAAVRSLWQHKTDAATLHACHLDMRDARVVAEVLGRTGGGDLKPVLDADVGGVDTTQLEGGKANAELADLKNRHPDGHRFHELTWRTVFLHSLAGRAEGLGSNLFGIGETDCCLAVAFPGLTPPQVQTALREIGETAYYLRSVNGRYYASLEPSVNIALGRLRRSFGDNSEAVRALLTATARKVVSVDTKTFSVLHDVTAPEHLPDNTGKPQLAMLALEPAVYDPEAFVTTCGDSRPRMEQNLVFLLVPTTVTVKNDPSIELTIFTTPQAKAQEQYTRLADLAKTVLAMQALEKNPDAHGISKTKLLADEDFAKKKPERENALVSEVATAYSNLWYPSTSGRISRKEVKTAGGEGGVSILHLIYQTLRDDNEIVCLDRLAQQLPALKTLFFQGSDVGKLNELRDRFTRLRHWPILENPSTFDQLIRQGVTQGHWAVFRMGNAEATRPEEYYSRDTTQVPLQTDLAKGDWGIVTMAGAAKRGWTKTDAVDPAQIRDLVRAAAAQAKVATVAQIVESVRQNAADVPEQAIVDAVGEVVRANKLATFKGSTDQTERPKEILAGTGAALWTPTPDDVVIAPAVAVEKGWVTAGATSFKLDSTDAARQLHAVLPRIGSLYTKGASTSVAEFDLTDLQLAKGGSLRLSIHNASPESMKALGELLQTLAGVAKPGDGSHGFLEVIEPKDSCPFIQAVKAAAPLTGKAT